MTNVDKSLVIVAALGQLHDELDNGTLNGNRQIKAIRDYIKSADSDIIARFYDILFVPSPLDDEVV